VHMWESSIGLSEWKILGTGWMDGQLSDKREIYEIKTKWAFIIIIIYGALTIKYETIFHLGHN